MSEHTRHELPADVAEIIRLVELAPLPSRPAATVAPPWRGRKLLHRFLLLVVLPTLLATGYFDLIATDRYVSEAKFLVRKAAAMPRPAQDKTSIEAPPPDVGGGNESYAVHDFMLSRDALHLLLAKADLRDILVRGRSDPLWRFPGFLTGDKDEDLYRYYRSLVSVDYDSSSGLTTLRAEAFNPVDAQRIADVLINGAEALMGRLNERAHADAVHSAQAELRDARDDAMSAIDHLTQFRDRESVVDPTLLSKTVLDTITALSLRLVEASAQRDVTSHSSPGNPQLPLLDARIQALQKQIDRERATLAGSDRSLAPRIAEYERLVLEKELAEKRLASADGVLDMAKQEAQRQEIYLERVVEPNRADEAVYPRRIAWPLGVLLTGLALFWVFRPAPAPRRRAA